MRCQKDHGEATAGQREVLLKIEASSPRHSEIEHEATWGTNVGHFQEFGTVGKCRRPLLGHHEQIK
ncbi:hypothetical protein D3C87_1847800 [compost metagenome]